METLQLIAARSGLVLLYIFLFGSLLLTVLGLFGNWVIAATALILTLVGLGDLTWTWFFVILGLAVLGEVIESVLGLAFVAGKGGTRWGVIGAFVGGIAGAILGGPMAPPVGSVILAFVGAFMGAAAGEYLRSQQMEEALRVGFWSFVGRSLATMGKLAAGFGMVWIVIVTTW